MSREEVLQAVRDACAEILGVAPEAVTPASSLRDDLEADSLDLAEMVMALEDSTGISIAQDDLKDVKIVEDVISLIQRYVPAATS
jgi:acyl carrier protein